MSTITADDFPAFEPHMKGPLTFSVVFHVIVVIVAIIGLPHLTPELPNVDSSITVEIMAASDLPKAPDKVKPEPPKEVQKDEPPPQPAMPKVTASKPPKPTPPAPPEKIEEFVEPPKDIPKPEPAKKPEPVKAKTPEKKPEKKPVPAREEDQPDEEFKGLLKNLMEPEQTSQTKTENPAEGAPKQYSQMEMNQIGAAINQQLTACWKLIYGARYAEDLIVPVKLFMNPDGSVRDARIVDQRRYNTDTFYRAAADAALRAVYNPQCNPLDLPRDKYDLWKVINASFDPSQML